MFKKKAMCQSCGMPLVRDEGGGGTNADGSKSAEYCSYCYQHGAFTDPDITMEMMMQKEQDRLKRYRIPEVLRKHFTRHIPKLKRWQ